MRKSIRSLLLLVSAVQLLFAIAFYFQIPFVTGLWPLPGTTPLTFIFLASIFAAAAAATFWAAASEQYGALAGIGLDYLMILVPMGIILMQLGGQTGSSSMRMYGIICLLGALFGGWLFIWGARIPLDQSVAVPPLVRWSFVGFVVALLIVSTLLIFKVPNVIPWTITPDLSVIIGWMFFGAMTYFIYGLLRPTWANAAGQLMGFLAYDIVLLVPFLTRISTVPPEFRTGMWIYTAVVLYSGILAVYFLFIHEPTRVWRSRPALMPG